MFRVGDVVRIGVTGHIHLTESSRRLIYEALLRELRPYAGMRGVTCLAEGADRLFAQAVRECAGTYEVVLPGTDDPGTELLRLLGEAAAVSQLPALPQPAESYAAASEEMLRRSDRLVAVWDGDGRGGPGGTADTVARARARGVPVTVVWPDGAERCAA
jgi:hypothetical protein